ncbi:MAG: phosphatase PAP2 family protein [Hyphomonadaceae bacterium]|nr:phosphatase PAP2 family protein [Hyphomonadaceae bacterium]
MREWPGYWRRWAREDIGPISVFLAVSALVWGFVELAGEVGEGDVRLLDERILLALRTGDVADPIGPRWVELAMVDITALGGFAVLTLLTLLAAGYLLVSRKWIEAAMLVIAVGGGTLISEGLKIGFARPRPDLVAHVVETTSMSFPSGHAMLSAVTYLTLGALLAQAQSRQALRIYIVGAAMLTALLVGVSRIYLGVHWPTDVLGGWCLGAAWALICWAAAMALTRRRADK